MDQPTTFLRSTYISYSRLATFRKCPLQFKLIYLENVPSVSSKEAELGKLAHAVIARYYVGK